MHFRQHYRLTVENKLFGGLDGIFTTYSFFWYAMRFDKPIVCYFESKTCKTMAINTTRRDSNMRKCLIINKHEYEAFLNVYMMSQGVLGCKYVVL